MVANSKIKNGENHWVFKGRRDGSHAVSRFIVDSREDLFLHFFCADAVRTASVAVLVLRISDDVIKELNESKRGHIPFTNDEIGRLWNAVNDVEWVDVLLYQCYSGWRPQELGLIELRNVDLDNWLIIGGMKTDAGKDRIVPVHPRVRWIIEKHYTKAVELGSEFLFNCTDTQTHRSSLKLTYDKYSQRYEKIRDRLGLNPEHRAHDGRKHFITMAKKYDVDEYAIKYIVGHAINDITEKVYTEREVSWLAAEIEKIP